MNRFKSLGPVVRLSTYLSLGLALGACGEARVERWRRSSRTPILLVPSIAWLPMTSMRTEFMESLPLRSLRWWLLFPVLELAVARLPFARTSRKDRSSRFKALGSGKYYLVIASTMSSQWTALISLLMSPLK